MALSNSERKKKKLVSEMVQKVKMGTEKTKNRVTRINEDSTPKISDLAILEKTLENKTMPYLEPLQTSTMDGEVNISFLFLSNEKKGAMVDPKENFINIGLDPISSKAFINPIKECTIEEFIGLPRKVESNDFKSTEEITQLCDSSEIYNIYYKKAVNIVRNNCIVAYNMFANDRVMYKVEEKDVENTLYVGFDRLRGKFKFSYNPDFILENAIEEWVINKRKYDSLIDCYLYNLSFLIIHEMYHIIEHNVTTTINFDDDRENHDIDNRAYDSAINCKISTLLNRVYGVKLENDLAPMPRVGISDTVAVRAEHGKGFKEIADTNALLKQLSKTFSGLLKENVIFYSVETLNLNKYKGADVFCKIKIAPTSILRLKGTLNFKATINEIVKLITDGKVLRDSTPFTDAEKEADLDILPNGVLVQVKGTSEVCIIKSYDEETKEYTLLNTEISKIDTMQMPDGTVKKTPSYTGTNIYGKRHRRDIRVFKCEDGAWIEDNQKRKKKNALTKKDLLGDTQQTSGNDKGNAQVKVLHIGDVVWINKIGKFGKIISINNGKIKLEEMEEIGVKVLDDSRWHEGGAE